MENQWLRSLRLFIHGFLVFALSANPLLVSTADELPSLNYSGEDGEPAQDGRSYKGSQARKERHGKHAGDAIPPTDATDGADLTLKLEQPDDVGFDAHFGFFTLSGTAYWPESRNTQNIGPIKVQFKDTTGLIDVITDGGDGQRGGFGGWGQVGGDGVDGEDLPFFNRTIEVSRDPGYDPFSRWNFGGSLFNGGSFLRRGPFGLKMPTEGTNSGDGGDAGAGTNGSNAGHAGDIALYLDWSQTHLLTLFNFEQKAGKPGEAGEHGKPGEAGEPGEGGDGGYVTFVWYEEEKKKDENGDTYYEDVKKTRRVLVPDADDGEKGERGEKPTHRLRRGKKATHGDLQVHVTEKDGSISTYSSVFDLEVVDYEILSRNQDGTFEPGEGGFVQNITVYNPSDMPTPENVRILVYLSDGQYIQSEAIPLEINGSIPGNTSLTLRAQLPFKVRNNLLTQPKAEPTVWGDRVQLVSEMESTKRPFRDFHSGDHLTIRYPIAIEQVSALNSIGSGEATKVWLKITNISGKDFTGANGIRRQVETLIQRTGGDIAQDQIELFDEFGNPLDLKGWAKDISQLKDRDSLIVKAIIGASKEAESSRSAQVNMNLAIQNIENPEQMDVIQTPSIEFRVNQAYQKTKDSDFLLIINSDTPKEAVDAWKELAARLDGKIDIWDLSRETHLELTKELISGSRLLDDFRGKTLVMLNNPFEVASVKMSPEDQLNKKEFLRAVTERNINFYMAGDQDTADLSNFMLTPGFDSNDSQDFASIDRFMEGFKRGQLPDQLAEFEGLDYTDVFSNIRVNKYTFWGRPSEDWMERQSEKIRTRLRSRRPTSRYFTVTKFKPELIKKTWFFKQWGLGEIQVARSTDTSLGTGVFLKTDAAQLNDPNFILGLENTTALIMGLSTREKIERINKFLQGDLNLDETTQQALLSAIMVDIAKEQGDLRYHVWRGELSAFKIRQELQVLETLTKTLKALPPAADNQRGQFVTSLLGSMQFLASAQRTFWDYILPARNNSDVSKVTQDLTSNLYNKLFSIEGRWVFKKSKTGYDLSQVNKRIQDERMGLQTELSNRRTKGDDRREVARTIFTEIADLFKLGRDQFNSPNERDLRPNNIDEMRQRQKQRTEKAKELSRTVDEKRKELLVPHPRYSTKSNAELTCQTFF